MENEIDQEWQFDVNNRTAVHVSGLQIAVIERLSDDKNLRLEYGNLLDWKRKAYQQTQDLGAVDLELNRLSEDFVRLYRLRHNIKGE